MHNLDPSRRRLAAGLAALAGYVDAVGFLSADRYFVSFMSGNTTRLATELVVSPATAVIPALLIAGFVLGSAAGAFVRHKAGRWRKPGVLALVTALLGIGAGLGLAGQVAAMMGCLVLAMGALNNAVESNGAPIALTYLTGALVRMGQYLGDRLARREGPPVAAPVALWLSLSAGAATGASLFVAFGPVSLILACAASAAMTLIGARLASRAIANPQS
ncbi:DUF1275 domain-containing protein [Novosphingobium sp. 1949]|uniref:DUF1275 domain-containing protein n=1 Tax=Novosphingobium organovorum TaxID=2930092 RepID=A0ABT0BHI3_9SPHN|nr:YoaK family protein [Novosphingobium organovorum]MCJ2184261.1 DUF1275 domain-containing protein [Novosphingobium organovorum]